MIYRCVICLNLVLWFSFFNKDLATNETIFSAISMLSNAIASAPIGVYKDYEKLKPYESDLARLFEYGPNNFQSTFQFIRLMETLRNTKGAAYAIKEYGYMGAIERLWVLNPDFVNHITSNGYTPISPLDVLRNTIDYDREIKEFSLNQMKNGLKANIVIKLQTKLSEPALKEYNAMMDKFKENGVLYVDSGKSI